MYVQYMAIGLMCTHRAPIFWYVVPRRRWQAVRGAVFSSANLGGQSNYSRQAASVTYLVATHIRAFKYSVIIVRPNSNVEID